MTSQTANASNNESEIQQQYNKILVKLRSTVANHRADFPQLSTVEKFLDVEFPEANRDEDFVNRLDEICSFLNKLSSGSYIIRHLHHYLCGDVELVKNKTFHLLNEHDDYLIFPG
ncbi:hypothetical protein [Pontibacter populi]|uniref:Uncharacterized protein n=1 Tax=Pontibacter populi TaxID=890055 RepID=A0ABV1RX63_9BACT